MAISGIQKIMLENGREFIINFDEDDVYVTTKKVFGSDSECYIININCDIEKEISKRTYDELVEAGVKIK